MRRLLLAVVPVLAAAVGACGSSSSNSSSSSTPASSSTTSSGTSGAGGTIQATMKNLAFDPKSINAKVGQTIEWTNDDSPPHDVSYVSGPKFTSSGTLNNGQTFTLKLSQAGTIHYFCSIHPFMKATIDVTQ